MPSTYTLNNGIELIGTGEQSGTWGSTTNTNLELLDTALDGQVTVTLSSTGSSGSPNALPISDGSNSDGRNRLIIFNDGSDLGGTAYVQLTPNDAEKIIYVRNSLSGSRSILLFQGTYNASNDYEVPAGTTAVVFFNGAGSGAVAANVFNNAHFDALNVVGSVTVGGGVTVTGTVDAGTVEFDNLSGTGAVSVTNILDEDNMASNSATALSTQQSIKAYVDSQVGTVDTLAEILANGNTTGGNDIVFSAGDNITNASGDLTLDVAGDIILDADGGDIRFKDGGTEFYKVAKNGDHVQLFSTIQDGDLTFNGFDGASHIVALTLDMSAAGAATFNAGVTLTGTLNVDSSTTNGFLSAGSNILNFGTSSNDTVAFYANNTEHMKLKPDGEVIINETGGAEGDLRVESDSNSHMLFVDAGNDHVNIGSSTDRGGLLNVDGTTKGIVVRTTNSAAMELIYADNGAGVGPYLYLNRPSSGPAANDQLGQIVIQGKNSADEVIDYARLVTQLLNPADGSEQGRFAINTITSGIMNSRINIINGESVFNDDSVNVDFRVESNNNANALFVDAGTGRVGINNSSPANTLDVTGSVIGSVGFSSATPTQTTNTPFGSPVGGGPDSTRTLIVSPPSEKQSSAIKLGGGNTGGNNSSAWISSQYTGAYAADIRLWAPRLGNYTYGDTDATNVINCRETETNFYSQVSGTSGAIRRTLNLSQGNGAIFNPDGIDIDFRVESDGNTHAIFVDGAQNTVGIGTSSTFQMLTVNGNIAVGGAGNKGIYFGDNITSSADQEWLLANNASSSNSFILYEYDSGSYVSQRVEFLSGGNTRFDNGTGTTLVINEAGNDADFRVESDANANMFVVNAADSTVGIGTIPSTNYRTLTVVNALDTDNSQIHIHGSNAGIYIGESYTGGFGGNGAIARAAVAGYHVSSSLVGDLCIGAETAAGIRFGTQASGNGLTNRMYISENGAVSIAGSLSKGSGSFKIDHPLPEKTETHHLIHSFVESPQADNIYRGKVDLVAGQATVNIDTVAGMTEGTFATLNREIQCFTSNETGWTAVRGSVSGNILTIEAQDNTCTDTVSWLVVGERQDQHMYDTDWTDDNGKVIVEPLKENA